jgi:hypothetical protein
MNLSDFQSSLSDSRPPRTLSPLLSALWFAARGKWDKAHALVQDESGAEAAWVHAYLHRQEGDLANAGYWYRRAKRPMPQSSLEDEWRIIAATFLEGEDEE